MKMTDAEKDLAVAERELIKALALITVQGGLMPPESFPRLAVYVSDVENRLTQLREKLDECRG